MASGPGRLQGVRHGSGHQCSSSEAPAAGPHTAHTSEHNTDTHIHRNSTSTHDARTTHAHPSHNGGRPDSYTHFSFNILGVYLVICYIDSGGM